MNEEPWYRRFFERDYYDTFYAPLRSESGRLGPEATEGEADFIVETLALDKGARLLDLCCGHGRHSIALARRGFEVVGLDISAYHVDLARKAAAAAGAAATFIVDDMRNLPLAPPFDAVINMFTAFGYLESDAEDQRVLDRVASALKPGGRFLIETNNTVGTLRRFQAGTVTRLDDGTLLIEEHHYDMLTGRNDATWTFVGPHGERHEGDIHPRMYTAAELRRMIEAAGMRVVRACGGVDRSELTMDSRRAILIAEKPP